MSINATSTRFIPFYAIKFGIQESALLSVMSAIIFANAILGLVIGYIFDSKNKKYVYVSDIILDAIPPIIYAFTRNILLFWIAYALSQLKDVLAPISFAYYFECFSQEEGSFFLGVLASLGNAIEVILPPIIGYFWSSSYETIFLLGAAGVLLSFIVGILTLPKEKAS